MKYRRLGRTDIKVGVIGPGSVTFGEQNTEAEGHAQINYAGPGNQCADLTAEYWVSSR